MNWINKGFYGQPANHPQQSPQGYGWGNGLLDFRRGMPQQSPQTQVMPAQQWGAGQYAGDPQGFNAGVQNWGGQSLGGGTNAGGVGGWGGQQQQNMPAQQGNPYLQGVSWRGGW